MLNSFLPRDRTFWLYHGSALLLLAIIQGSAIFLFNEKRVFDTAAALLWVPLFTVGLLAFRAHYKSRNWQRFGMGRLIFIGLGYSLAIGAFVTLVMFTITLPIFWDYLFTPDFLEKHDTTIAQQLIRLAVGNTMSTQLFASGWIFIYLSVTTSRRAREAELGTLKLENSLKQARLSSLANQLNPHFLFNSLNNIRFMIHENPAHADHSITALSEILRYSLETGQREKVTLAEELAIIDRYIEVVSLQLEDRLDFQLTVPDDLRDCLVPPMSLQLLVENAIKHGIENIRKQATLAVTAESDSQSLTLTVGNPIPQTKSPQSDGTGTGLKNIEQRLHLLYGDAASIAIDNGNQRFIATLTLPKEDNS